MTPAIDKFLLLILTRFNINNKKFSIIMVFAATKNSSSLLPILC